MRDSDAGAGRGGRAGGGPWVAAGANLALGLFAVLPFRYIQWLMTYVPPVDRGSPSTGDTGFDAPYAASPIDLWGAALSGLIVLALTVVVDFLMPRQEGWPMRVWLAMAVLIPVPFLVCEALGLF